eukprot:COSAG02_NODE_3270_length_7035_cov_21.981978_2_plen_248_part_00
MVLQLGEGPRVLGQGKHLGDQRPQLVVAQMGLHRDGSRRDRVADRRAGWPICGSICATCVFVAFVWSRLADSYRPAVAQVLTRCSTVLLVLLLDPPFIRYDEKSELAQAKRDCIALAEEVQRLRAEVEKERTGRKKAIAAKKQAESDRDDAVARLVAVQSGRPMATVEEAAPPDAAAISARIPEGDTTTGLSKTDSFERAEAEAGAWGGKHRTVACLPPALSRIVRHRFLPHLLSCACVRAFVGGVP